MMRFIYSPTEMTYSVEDSSHEYLRAQLQGGAGRYRSDIVGGSQLVTARWVVDGRGYNYLCAFYRVFKSGVEPFEICLINGEAAAVPHVAWFVPGSWKLEEKRGPMFFVTAQLEIEGPEYCVKDDSWLVAAAGMLGPEWGIYAEKLDSIMNIMLPEILQLL